ncbi:MAG: hypothetical protein SCG84_07365 [Nitrosomonadaceae bacterium]|nr:hypothetical protein [Nitrosomonadaceae bacterium]MDW7598949.1 hypothetical protein [Nitrosomonadaceae bacterium]MDW7619680.1 hypothetical protein [Nitrosomonadaceae bacterium]MDW7666500.1 hypothetical protein [Nitrosomonadaceae bacterium]
MKLARYRYFLTEKGESLKPALSAILTWDLSHYPGTSVFPRIDLFSS